MRSFADGNGDGIGDLAGVRARLPYLADLGVDAIWFNPWYPSPMADAGYDVADYRDIDPAFGTLAEADALIAEAHALGIRIIIDIVPNHCSDQHPWFQAALAAGPGSPERDRFWFRPGRGAGRRPAAERLAVHVRRPGLDPDTGPDGTPGEWYLHLFAPEQPDFNWANPEVRAEFEDVLRFWFDRGADGIRIDSAALLIKDPALPGAGPDEPVRPTPTGTTCTRSTGPGARVADSYAGRALIGEVWLPDAARFARYLRPDELHTAFNFPFLCCAWDAARLREVIDSTLAPRRRSAPRHLGAVQPRRHPARDPLRPGRHLVRPGPSRPQPAGRPGARHPPRPGRGPAHHGAARVGVRLPGRGARPVGGRGHPRRRRQDPIWHRTGGADPGRDGCRVPLPWSGAGPAVRLLAARRRRPALAAAARTGAT